MTWTFSKIFWNMGNCCDRCFGRIDKRKYLRTRYNVERDFSIEFENLMEEETVNEELANGHASGASSGAAVTADERCFLLAGRYDDLMYNQRQLDAEIDAKLVHQEEELRMEEEAYYEAKREAARVAKMQRQKDAAAKAANAKAITAAGGAANQWGVSDGECEIAEDDFESFLENVKARSLAARTRALASQVPVDAQSTSSTQTRGERSHTDASSIDLEWEHEAGMHPVDKKELRDKQKLLEEKFSELGVKPTMLQQIMNNDSVMTAADAAQITAVGGLSLKQSLRRGGGGGGADVDDDDLQWDNDLTSEQSSAAETRHLLSRAGMGGGAGRGGATDDEADR